MLNAAGQYSQIQAQNAAAQAAMNAAAAAAANDFNLIDQQEKQLSDQANLEAAERQKQAMRERAKIMVAMGEAGVGGASSLRLINNTLTKQQIDQGIIMQNLENRLSAAENQKAAVYANEVSRFNQAKSSIVDSTTGLFRILGAGMSGFGSGYGLGSQIWPQE